MSQPLPLRPYQIADLAVLMQHPRACLLHDPGGGKTPPVCVWIEWRWREAGEQTVWVMPKSLFRKNRDELLRFTTFAPEHIAIVDGPHWPSGARVYLIGPDRFRLIWQKMPAGVRNLVADELHMYWSSNGSKRTQAWYAAMRRIPRFVGMTGTLVSGRLDSAYPTIHVIEPRYYGSYQGFLAEHAILDEYNKAIAWKNPEKLAAILGRHAIRRSFQDIHGAEEKVIVVERTEMSPAQRKAYDEFEARALLELENEFLVASTGGVAAMRCRQIMACPETWGLLPKGEITGKDQLLDVHLANHERTGEPLLVYAVFVKEQERILRLVRERGLRVALMNGDTPPGQRAEIDARFRAGTLQVLVASPQVAAIGFNWSHVNHVVFTTLDYQATTFIQAYRRAIRGRRDRPLLIHVLEYADSLDQRVFEIIRRKSELERSVDGTREVFDFAATGR
jgi:SNF2 family DNA or RNA helicase